MDEILDILTYEELREKFMLLLNIAKCAVCLESVRQEMVQCHNGHLICFDCKVDMQTCPTCRGKFSHARPCQFISQVIEILPIRCKHRNCPKVLKSNDDHEKYCGFQFAECKWCSWEGTSSEIRLHCESAHNVVTIQDKRIWPTFDINKRFIHFTGNVFPGGYFFWEETINRPNTKMFTKTWYFVPNDKATTDFFVTLSFKSESGRFTATKIKLDLDPDAPSEENSISIPHSMLCYFIDESGALSYTVKESTD